MPEYLSPGVYVEEIDSGSKPIEGVGVSTGAFVGYARSGEFNNPIFITNWGDFVREFGDDDDILLKPLSEELGMAPTAILDIRRNEKKSLLEFAQETVEAVRKTREKDPNQLPGRSASIDDLKKKYKIDTPLGAGPYIKDSYLAYAVKGFYDNGGSRAYIVRVPREEDVVLLEHLPSSLPQPDPIPPLPAMRVLDGGATFRAKEPGAAGNDIEVEIVHKPDDANGFRVRFIKGKESEDLPSKEGTYFTVADVKRASGKLAEYVEGAVALAERPPQTKVNLMDGSNGSTMPQPRGPDGLTLRERVAKAIGDLPGNADGRYGAEGLYSMEDVNFVAVPDLMAGAYARNSPKESERCVFYDEAGRRVDVLAKQKLLVDYFDGLNDRMIILDSLPNLNPQQAAKAREDARFSCDHGQAALYYPWIRVPDMLNRTEKATILVPPCGHVAGVWARTAVERGVHKAPANESLKGAIGMGHDVSKAEQDKLNPIGVNCIRSFPASGIRIWGARTLATESNPSWRYVNVRNLFNYLKRSIDRGTQWVVFEPNDQDLWDRVRRNISAFLWTAWKEGMLFGRTPNEAFTVKCDAETNPEQMRDLGRLYVEIGINPVKPAEFVIIRMGQWSGGSENSEN